MGGSRHPRPTTHLPPSGIPTHAQCLHTHAGVHDALKIALDNVALRRALMGARRATERAARAQAGAVVAGGWPHLPRPPAAWQLHVGRHLQGGKGSSKEATCECQHRHTAHMPALRSRRSALQRTCCVHACAMLPPPRAAENLRARQRMLAEVMLAKARLEAARTKETVVVRDLVAGRQVRGGAATPGPKRRWWKGTWWQAGEGRGCHASRWACPPAPGVGRLGGTCLHALSGPAAVADLASTCHH